MEIASPGKEVANLGRSGLTCKFATLNITTEYPLGD